MNNNYKNTREEVIIELEALLLDCEETEGVAYAKAINSTKAANRYFMIKGGIMALEEALCKLKEI